MPPSRILLLILLGLMLPFPAIADTVPMTDEDVVRMFVSGRSIDEILLEIGRRDPAFDLSPEMLAELRNVHLPQPVIDAMLRRQRVRDSIEREAEQIEARQSDPLLRIKLDPTQTISLAERIDPQQAAEWELGNAPEDRRFADLVLYVACHTGEHVPDQWRNNSPLGRDFWSMRRHRMLAFITAVSGAEQGDDSDGRRIKLDLPPSIEVPLEPGIEHDLTLGLAVQIGGRYRRVTDARWDGLLLDDDGLEVEAIVKGRRPGRLRVRFERDDDDDECDDESPDDVTPGP